MIAGRSEEPAGSIPSGSAAPGAVRSGRARVLAARWLWAGRGSLLADAGLLIVGERIERVLSSRSAIRRAGAEVRPLGDVFLTPGLVNAHAHLELSALAGRVSPAGGFVEWIRRLMSERGATARADLAAGHSQALSDQLRFGVTAVGDVDSLDLGLGPLPARRPRLVLLREALDGGDPSRAPEVLKRLRAAPKPRARVTHGLSPHGPHTASGPLLAELGRLAARTRRPVAVHWAETREEVDWLAGRQGPFDALLGPASAEPASGLERLIRAGLVGPRTALVHANHPEPGERERVAGLGATVVHCPGAQRFFGRERFPFEAWRAAGVPVALGTDSLAGSATLNLAAEMRVLAGGAQGPPAEEVFVSATESGARALGLGQRVGRLQPGMQADLVAWPLPAGTGADPLAVWLELGPAPLAVWLRGRQQ